eukprot:1190955-Prorocentrum_minimum.AAC.1
MLSLTQVFQGAPHSRHVVVVSRWRVDVTIASNSLARVLRPSMLMEMTLSDGSIKTFEVRVGLRSGLVTQAFCYVVSPEQFHALRHAVARSIHEMDALEPKLEQVAEMERRVVWKGERQSSKR